ncbi:PilZ domain-containing protein, partial [Methylophaga pinxianii]
MATESSKVKNQAFLAQLERQRLQKPCQRIIDLRGKVSGECQPYQFGEITHYLDDRSYLILKQLVERMGGQYTVGAYEALIQAVRQFQQQAQQQLSPPIEDKSVLLLRLDKPIRRQAQRVLLTLPVTVHNADISYHAMTLDVSIDAIRVSMKHASALKK